MELCTHSEFRFLKTTIQHAMPTEHSPLPALDVRCRCSGPCPVLKEGVLDPFPLLLEDGVESGKRRGSFDLVNPLLLVTETKGMAYSLHYGAFPLDAFHTDGEIFQDL